MSDKRRELSNIDARPGTGRSFMCRTATGEKRRVFAEEHIAFTEIFLF